MKDFEEWMKKAPVSRVSPGLDLRIERACREAEIARPAVYRIPVPLWACAAVCLIFTVAGLTTGLFLASPSPGADGSRTRTASVRAQAERHRILVPYVAGPIQGAEMPVGVFSNRVNESGFNWVRYFDEREALVRQRYTHLPAQFNLLKPAPGKAYEARMDRYTERRKALEKQFGRING